MREEIAKRASGTFLSLAREPVAVALLLGAIVGNLVSFPVYYGCTSSLSLSSLSLSSLSRVKNAGVPWMCGLDLAVFGN